MGKKFTVEEEQYIMAHYRDANWYEIADALGRSYQSVRIHVNKKLGLKHDARSSFTSEEDEYLLEHYQNEDYETMAKVLGRSKCSVQHRVQRLGKKRRTTERIEFTPEEDKWLIENIPNHLYRDICKMFEQKFGKHLTAKQLHGHIANVLHVSNGNKGNQKFRAEKFEPIGYEYTNPRGYTYIKVKDTNNQNEDYRAKHQVMYEKYHGELPEGFIVVFLDGNTQNFNKDNLYAIPKKIHCRLNLESIYGERSKDLTLAAIKTWELHYAIEDAN